MLGNVEPGGFRQYDVAVDVGEQVVGAPPPWHHGVGENDAAMRAAVCGGLEPLGIEIDASRNEGARGKVSAIHTADARVGALVVETDEELEIARQTYALAVG